MVLRVGQRRLHIFQRQLELIGIKLLGPAPETVAHEGIDNCLQPLDPGIGLVLCIGDIGQRAGLLEHERPQRIDIVRQVRIEEHGGSESAGRHPVKRQSAVQSGDARHAPGASPTLPAARQVARP